MTSPADAEREVDLEEILRNTIESPQLRDSAIWELHRLRERVRILEGTALLNNQGAAAEVERLGSVRDAFWRWAESREPIKSTVAEQEAFEDGWRGRDAEVERLDQENAVLRSMLADTDPCIHQQIQDAKRAHDEGRTMSVEEYFASRGLGQGAEHPP